MSVDFFCIDKHLSEIARGRERAAREWPPQTMRYLSGETSDKKFIIPTQ